MVGGAAVTEEFHPGFRNSVAAYTVSLLNPTAHHRPAARLSRPCASSSAARRTSCPASDGRYLLTGDGRTHPIGRKAERDAMRRRIDTFTGELETITDVLQAIRAARAAEPGGGPEPRRRHGNAQRARQRQHPARPVAREQAQCCSTCSPAPPVTCSTTGSRATWSKRCSASTPLSATMPVPTPPGSAYVMLHHAFGEVNGRKGVLGPRHRRHGRDHPGDGVGRPRHGVEIETDAGVREVIVEKDRAVGVPLDSGETIRARACGRQRQPKPALHPAGPGRCPVLHFRRAASATGAMAPARSG